MQVNDILGIQPKEDSSFGYIRPGMNEEKAKQNDGTMVTIICVTYAHEEFIEQCLDSIVSQKTNFKFKVFVGEDCGPDRTAEIVLQYAQKYPDIVVPFIRSENMGSKRNMVDLIEHATSPYICFCDGDDYWIDEYKLQKQFDYMEQYPTVRACFARVKIDAPSDWYLNDYFKANKDGDRIIPDCLPGYNIFNRLLTAADIIKFHPMHTVTVFYRWNYEIGFPDWFFYGVLGDIPMSLLQIGNGKVCFMPDVFGIYRRSDVGIHMFTNKDEHFVKTRGDYINYLQGIRSDFSFRFKNYCKGELEKRLKQEWTNLIRAALRSNQMDVVAETIKMFPESAALMFDTYSTFFEDGKRMWGAYGHDCYQLIARDKYFMRGFSPVLKVLRKIRNGHKRIVAINWKKSCVNLWKKTLKIPFAFFFDRKLPKEILEVYNTNAELVWSDMPYKLGWNEFEDEVHGKSVIFCGFGPGVWKMMGTHTGIGETAKCIIGFGEKKTEYRGIPIVEWQEVLRFKRDYLTDDVIFLLTDCHAARLGAAMQFMEELGVTYYYSYAYMEGTRPEHLRLKGAYNLKFRLRENFQKNGLLKNGFLFELNKWRRKHKLTFDWKRFEQMEKYKNIHDGETCYIVGTGPSLTMEDIELLKGKTTFSVNGIYRLFSETNWRPTYYVVCDPNACTETFKYFKTNKQVEQMKDVAWDSFCQEALFMPEAVEKYLEGCATAKKCNLVPYSYLNQHINPYYSIFRYQKDFRYGSYNMRTVVNFCINIAHYMGFKRIVLIGVDCDYTGTAQYFDGSTNIHVTNMKTSENKPYQAWLTQREMIRAYKYIQECVKSDDVEIVNATRGGHLEVFERIELEEAVND